MHALMWNGSACDRCRFESNQDSFESTATGVSGGSQVGWGTPQVAGQHHALLWQGTAVSAIDLNPAGYGTSEAWAASGGSQVGWAGYAQHAMLWNGTAASYVDLHPNAWSTSFATGVSGNVQVGFVYGPNANGRHSVLWKGNAASFIDLNPAGFSTSSALAAAGDLQVGYGDGGGDKALLWSGTAASVVNLHQFLSGLGVYFSSSYATGVASDGTIVGYARGPFDYYAVLWTPVEVPEPASCVLLACGLALVSIVRSRRCRQHQVNPSFLCCNFSKLSCGNCATTCARLSREMTVRA